MGQQSREYSDEISLNELWKVVVNRKRFIIGLFVVAVISTTIISVLTPNIYRGEALLNILTVEELKEISGKEVVQSKEIIQAKEMVDVIGNIDREKKRRIFPATYSSVTDLKLRPIKDSTDKVLVTIEAKNKDHILRAFSELLDYVNGIDSVKLTLKEEKEKLLIRSSELAKVIDSSEYIAHIYRKLLNEGRLSQIGFNPVDLEKRIADIKLEKLSVDQRLQRLSGGAIEIEQKPYVQDHAVKPKIGLNIALAGMMSIFLGIFLVFFEHGLKKIRV